MLHKSCEEWIAELASGAPTPGGGGASALVGAVGIALGSMVGNLTVGKKKYADVETEMQELLKKSDELMKKLEDLVEQDALAFAPLAAAYRLPAGTAEEKRAKEDAVQEALIGATACPMSIAKCCYDALELLEEYAHKGSVMAVSDAGVGAACCRAALEGARLNILINLKLMKDEDKKQFFKGRLILVVDEGIALADRIYQYVREQLTV
ncbi:cyclodeaminase/cyclohydrolase family protein [Bacilliculturomica massiliensis]|uniref:cyclodeaminase/cyclohydrolase family protein n=1 Tax=Bacilliculturomica massiliensis TaxID=1917867 RepID=UPI00102F6B47|nr:cyclodeaminase/cyclohydrolase family protein [Bacilliculturomica massiliensis]